MLAAPTYAGQLCYTSFEECNLYSPCAYLSPRRNCSASLASLFTTCTSGPANLNSSNLAQLGDGAWIKANVTNATGFFPYTDYQSDETVNGEDQFVCDAVNEDFNAIPGASGALCYPDATLCEADPLNPCSSSTPCGLDMTWCGSGMALGFGALADPPANNSWACTALQVPVGALPQGNEFQCFDTQAHCEAEPAPGSMYANGCSAGGVNYTGSRLVAFDATTGLPVQYRCQLNTSFCKGGLAGPLSYSWVCPD